MEKLDQEYFENQTKLNLSEFYSPQEIKLLKKTIPDISNLIYLVPNNDKNNADNSRSFSGGTYSPQPQYRYYSSVKKIRNNSNYSCYIDKEKFYTMILDLIKQIIVKENNTLLTKSISLIIDELLNISKIIKQNLIYNQFFKSIKKAKLYEIKKSKQSFSQYRNKTIKIKYKPIEKNYSNYEMNFPKMNISDNKASSSKEVYSNDLNVKKQLSFEMDSDTKISQNKVNKSAVDHFSKEKDKNTKGNLRVKNDINYISKKEPTKIKNKVKININQIKSNKNSNSSNKNISYINNNQSHKKNIKKVNNNYFLGSSKISLKKFQNNNKKIGLYDIMHNKKDYNLTNITINKKNFIEKEISSKKNLEKLEKNYQRKILKPSNINPNLYKNIETQEFNIFNLEKEIGRENVLPLIGYYIFKFFNFEEIIKYNKFEKWSQKIADGYVRNNFYHNDLHAADITQTCLLYFKLGEFESINKFSKSSKCSLFLSCMCHDYQHPGVNNNFLKETNNKIAIRYNDSSILENMHISKTFKLCLNNAEYNVFDGIEKNLYKQMRKEMISCVLSTDMAFHNVYVDFLKKCVNEKKEESQEKEDDKKKDEKNQKYMNVLIHSADISNPTKLFDIYFGWAKLVVEEFWDQGDKEKKLNLICSCDRDKVTIYQSQLGFINFIEIPYFSLLAEIAPKCKFFYDNLLNNKNILLNMQEKDKKEKEKENQKEKEKNE